MAEGRVLVVDDEDNIRDLVASAMRLAGFEVRTATNAAEGLALTDTEHPDLLVLDVMMPDMDGYEMCRCLRARGDDTPVIFLTARDGVEDRVRGFGDGADDYLIKPFSLEELVARTRAVLRRARPGEEVPQVPGLLVYADLQLDEPGLRVSRGDRQIQLSPTELRLLRYLLINREHVVSRDQIVDAVWENHIDGTSGIVENYISYLRKKIDAHGPPLIHTVRGFGYVLRAEP
jgi:two-component system, OmpR family, response regulator